MKPGGASAIRRAPRAGCCIRCFRASARLWSRPGKRKPPPFPLRAEPQNDSGIVAKLAPGVVANVKKCDGTWCRLKGDGYDGYMLQTNLWGVYPDEKVE